MFPILETARLRLREITKDDAEALYSYFSRDEVTKYYGQDSFTSLEQAQDLIEKFKSGYEEKRAYRWGIERKECPRLIGTIGFHAFAQAHKRAEVGYDLHPDFWRKGIASEALSRVIDYGFETLDLTRIGAIVYAENEASHHMLLKNGFVKEGVLRKYMYQSGRAYDTNVYSIIK